MVELTNSVRSKFQSFSKSLGKDELDFAEFSIVLKSMYKNLSDAFLMDLFKSVKDSKVEYVQKDQVNKKAFVIANSLLD